MSSPLSCKFVLCTFGLRSRAVRVAQCQQGHLYQLVKQQISLDQHKLGMFLSPLSFQRAFLVLHHAEHWQQAPCGDGHILCHTAWHWRWQCIGLKQRAHDIKEIFFNQKKILQKTQSVRKKSTPLSSSSTSILWTPYQPVYLCCASSCSVASLWWVSGPGRGFWPQDSPACSSPVPRGPLRFVPAEPAWQEGAGGLQWDHCPQVSWLHYTGRPSVVSH